jgi:hypothetical protein
LPHFTFNQAALFITQKKVLKKVVKSFAYRVYGITFAAAIRENTVACLI